MALRRTEGKIAAHVFVRQDEIFPRRRCAGAARFLREPRLPWIGRKVSADLPRVGKVGSDRRKGLPRGLADFMNRCGRISDATSRSPMRRSPSRGGCADVATTPATSVAVTLYGSLGVLLTSETMLKFFFLCSNILSAVSRLRFVILW